MSENWRSVAIRLTQSLRWALSWLDIYIEPVNSPYIDPEFADNYRCAGNLVAEMERKVGGLKDDRIH